MPSPIHPTTFVRREGDEFVFGPIGWLAKMPDQTLKSKHDAVQTILILRDKMPGGLVYYLGPKQVSQ